MEFVKKNYMKIALAALALAGAVLFVIILANFSGIRYGVERNPALGVAGGADPNNARGALFGYLAALFFFSGLAAVIVMSMLNEKIKKHTKWAVCFVGALCTLFMSFAIIFPARSDSFALLNDIRSGDKDARLTMSVQSEVIRAASAIDGAEGLMLLEAMPMSQWYQFVESARNPLQGTGITDAEAAELEASLDELRAVINAEAAIAIQTARDSASYQYRRDFIILITQLIIFGLLPLAYGAKLFLTKKEEQPA